MNIEIPNTTPTEEGSLNQDLGFETIEISPEGSELTKFELRIEPGGHFEGAADEHAIVISLISGHGRIVIPERDAQMELGHDTEYTTRVVVAPGETFTIYRYSFEGSELVVRVAEVPDTQIEAPAHE